MSLFVSFEGGEGSGKTTQAGLLVQRLVDAGVPVFPVHEPGTTGLGQSIREWLKRGLPGEEPISHNAELLLFAAARAELVVKEIQPALSSDDTVVIADRYVDSTTAYQGYGRGIAPEYIEAINRLATQGVMPQLTILLDCSPEEGLTRVGSLQLRLPLESAKPADTVRRDREGTRFEEEPLEFHQRVRRGYRELASREPDRWTVIDATKSANEISAVLWNAVTDRLPGKALKTSSGFAPPP